VKIINYISNPICRVLSYLASHDHVSAHVW